MSKKTKKHFSNMHFTAVLAIAMSILLLLFCGVGCDTASKEEDEAAPSASNAEQSAGTENQNATAPSSEATNAPTTTANTADGGLICYKRYEISGDNNYNITIFLRYKSGSDVVAEITGTAFVPNNDSDAYTELKNYDEGMKNRIQNEGIKNAEMSAVEETAGWRTTFSFTKLDESGNDSTVAFVAEYLDLEVENSSLPLANAESLLIEQGLALVDARG